MRQPHTVKEILESVQAIRQIAERLERRLTTSEQTEVDPYKRRRDLLQKIYWSGNSMSREELLPLLEASATDYRWIAQQVKMQYLSVLPTPGGGTRYSVTPKAVRELALHKEIAEEATAFARLSEASFAEDWNSPEDAIYDAV